MSQSPFTPEIDELRRSLLVGGVALAAIAALPATAHAMPPAPNTQPSDAGRRTVSTITTKDGTQIYYKDWGSGPVVVLCHGWPLSSDSWESQMLFLAQNGYRCIAHDRRGHGRSSQPSEGNDMDHYADDLAQVLDHLDVNKIALVGFSTGGGEVARYVGRHGTKRVAKLGLVSAVPPIMLKSDKNPGGVPIEVFDGLRKAQLADRSQFYKDLPAGPFYGFNRPGAKVSQGMIDFWWLQGMMGGHKNTYECIKAFSETDFTEDLKKFDVPTLVIHGKDDQVVPFDVGGNRSSKMIKNAKFIAYDGAPHGLPETHKDKFNADLLAFLKS
jgi:non-heme chloroperoxidase